MSISLQMIALAIAGLAAWSGCFLWAINKLLDRNEKRLDERLHAMQLEMGKSFGRVESVERDLLQLKADLPTQYVRRDDWIRFSNVIDAKLDVIRNMVDTLKEKIR